MPVLTDEALRALLRAGCPSCRRHHLRARAIVAGDLRLFDGQPVSTVTWTTPPGAFAERVYRVECVECGHLLYQHDDCPLCHAPGQLARALAGRHGVVTPPACPHCASPELALQAELRMHLVIVEGRPSRRVADAEPHEPAFHVTRVDCPACEQPIAAAGNARCIVCGRSSLLKRLRPGGAS